MVICPVIVVVNKYWRRAHSMLKVDFTLGARIKGFSILILKPTTPLLPLLPTLQVAR